MKGENMIYKDNWEAAKYNGVWAVFSKQSRTFSFIGCGKAYCTKKAEELNQEDRELRTT